MSASLRADIDRLTRALHEIAEEWAGAECGEPVTAQEAYAIQLAKRMYSLAVEALGRTKPPNPAQGPGASSGITANDLPAADD